MYNCVQKVCHLYLDAVFFVFKIFCFMTYGVVKPHM